MEGLDKEEQLKKLRTLIANSKRYAPIRQTMKSKPKKKKHRTAKGCCLCLILCCVMCDRTSCCNRNL